jgi:hypothetical protein
MISTSFTEGMDALLNVIEMWLNVIEILLIDFNQDVIALDWNTTSINFNHNQSRSIITGIFWRSTTITRWSLLRSWVLILIKT